MHKAVMLPIVVRHECTCPNLKEGEKPPCYGWEPPTSPFQKCKYGTVILMGEDGKAYRYCTYPPVPDCPPDPYRVPDVDPWVVERDFDCLIDQVKWHLHSYTEGGKERNQLLYMLDEVKRRAVELARKKGEKEK